NPQRWERWVRERWFETAGPAEAAAQRLASAAAGAHAEEEFMRALRQWRMEEMARIAFRDLAGWAALPETLEALSALAEAACEAALVRAERVLQRQYGIPRDDADRPVRPYVLGMGKLGGIELNFSSDIDLVFGYTAPGETDGPRPISNEQYFEKLVQLLTRYLNERTADGFVFRVDWRLRPFGASGPPAMHTTALEEYYQLYGREWERYALIKARPVAGDRAAGDALLKNLQPFIYRRYLDFNAVGTLRELKRKIEDDVQRRDLSDNVKLCAGGIRDVEFIVQVFQLMRGGAEQDLRDSRLRTVLAYLGRAGHLSPDTAVALDAAYCFLRRLENALQMYRDEQTHCLPAAAEARAALCLALGFDDWVALENHVQAVRKQVQSEFQRLFAESAAGPRDDATAAALSLLGSESQNGSAATAVLENLGYRKDPAAVLEAVHDLRQAPLVRALSDVSLSRLETLVAQVLSEGPRESDPETVACRVLKVIHAIAGRATYLTLLHENASARTQLRRLCAASAWITELIARSPVLLDQLLDERTLYAPPDREQMRTELAELFANVSPDDTEGAMNVLRGFQQEVTLRVAAADVAGVLPLVKVSDRLTWLAEVIVNEALARTRADLTRLYGQPRRADGTPAGFAVIAYGKFGGIEMGYGSDLDIIFLHDCDQLDGETRAVAPHPTVRSADGPPLSPLHGARDGGRQPAAARRLVNEVWLSRLAQRIIHWISTQTSAGRAYAVDLELRPEGRRGLIVSSLSSFEHYQKASAWTWEHQALTRARPVAGDERVQQAFRRVRQAVLRRPRDPAALRREVLDMRARMRKVLDKSRPGRFDVKQGEGGLTDIEFITQYLVLRQAPKHPALMEWTDHWRQTDALVAARVLEAGSARTLIETYRRYRAWLHACDLQQGQPVSDDEHFAAERAAVRALWRDLLLSEG
ncbi:MAG: bifunctional [glutamate--ammonia ligase]-adenylyl-L-tyrosine phosphorylase/[glutamate--ammonia-ligase] adenylyltransferase, partial [Nevskiales bacterium]|nr:bifunctional [glutamate--ammonia ligase]-adenylyl-L-tyrosine phosphorylase/[glutamate--ammonia-ligase] adenylyltransferase [Nevskiales bacterium]